MEKRIDIIILGATGFTGIHCIPYICKLSKTKTGDLSWGVAGRSGRKLKETLLQVSREEGIDLSNIPVVVTDINQYESLVQMARRARLVLNCCGPYRFLGYNVVKACLEARTHCLDVSGEPEFMEKIEVLHKKEAKEKGVYIISACGMDSIPVDLGVLYTRNEFNGVLNSAETILEFWQEGEPLPGPSLNFGTYETLVNSMHRSNIGQLREIRQELAKGRHIPECEPKLKQRLLPHKHKAVSGWLLPFPGADVAVARRTQQFLYEDESSRPVQVETYFKLASFIRVLSINFGLLIMVILAQCKIGKSLLLNNPKFFSLGFVEQKPPSEEKIKKIWFSISVYGEGWREKLADATSRYPEPPNRCILTKITGNNPAYGVTCLGLVLCGIVLLTEGNTLAGNGSGGVYSPGAVFANTSLIKQLHENGLKFEVLYQKDL